MQFNIFWDLPAYLFLVLIIFIVIIIFDNLRRKKKGGFENKKSAIVQFARDLFWVVLIVFILRAFFIEPFRIPSGSMLPNLLIGDFVLVNKSSYSLNLPLFNYPVIKLDSIERGDVIVFRYPNNPSIPFIKRVIGLPGDKIVYQNKTLSINGEKIFNIESNNYDLSNTLYDEYLNSKPIQILKEKSKIASYSRGIVPLESGFKVPANQYFVMGDNRDNSNDSRYWGFVPENHILGEAILVWANITTDGNLLTTNFDTFIRFFSTFKLSFDSAGKIKTGNEKDNESE